MTTIEKHIENHFGTSSKVDLKSELASLVWESEMDVLSKLKDVRDAAAWLGRILNDLVERIDRDGLDASVDATGLTGDLVDRVNLGCAELAGLKRWLVAARRVSYKQAA